MDLAKLVVRLEAQSAQLLTELERANNKVDRFASNTTKTLQKWAGGLTAAFSVASIARYTQGVINATDKLNDMAQQAGGVGVQTLSRLGYAAQQSGGDLDSMATSLIKLSNTMQSYVQGDKGAIAAFDALGVKVTNADGSLRKTDEVLKDSADSFSQYADGAAKTALAVDIFGKSGAALIPLLNQGREGIEALEAASDKAGATISDKTAKAAAELNDRLDALKSSADGVIATALAPALEDVARAMDEANKSGEGLSRFTTQLETGFKLLVDVGYSVYKTFDDIGGALGALAASAVAVAQGDFKRAAEIIKLAREDQLKSERDANAFLEQLWNGRTDTVKKSTDRAQELIAEADNALKKSLVYGRELPASQVQEVKLIGADKRDRTELEKFYDELNQLTMTQEETALQSFYAQREALKALRDDQQITAEQYADRLSAAQDELLPEFKVTVKKVKQFVDEINEYEKEAARNTQDIIADTFTQLAMGGDITAKSILQSFGEMIVKLTAQMAAADLAGRLFGKAGGGTGDGWLGAAANFAAGLFGGAGSGTMDSGGRGVPGKRYFIGTGAQPEQFIPDVPGTFVPAGAGMGGGVNNFNFSVKTEQPVTRRTEEQVAAAAFRGAMRANRRGN